MKLRVLALMIAPALVTIAALITPATAG